MSKTILVVDDSSMMRMTISKALESAGYNVLVANDGYIGLTKLDETQVDLIISDLNMPNINGLEFIEKCKQKPQYKFVPIVMLTTESQSEMIEKGRKLGIKAWIVKPFDPEKLIKAVTMLA
jgi:two-component system chemotaxis response regulator CheY